MPGATNGLNDPMSYTRGVLPPWQGQATWVCHSEVVLRVSLPEQNVEQTKSSWSLVRIPPVGPA